MRQVTSIRQIPLEIIGAATAYRLGMPEKIFSGKPETLRYPIIGSLCIVLGIVFIATFLLTYQLLMPSWPLWQLLLLPLIGFAWLALGGWILFAPAFYPRTYIYVCPEGLIVSTRKLDIIRWDQMERLWKQFRPPDLYAYSIRRSDGARFEFTHELNDITSLGALIEHEITLRLLKRAISAYRAGDTISFDALLVNRKGIAIPARRLFLSWEQTWKLEITEQDVLLYQTGHKEPQARLKAARIPNLNIMCELITYAQREHALLQYPHIQAYNTGSELDFGPLAISRHGITLYQAGITLPWDEIKGVNLGEEDLMLGRKGTEQEWFAFPRWMLHHLDELSDLLRYIELRQLG
ncbi:hypothetical protein EI42_04214 [Thermosporothrix hazakensis]|uniref:Uncharacterized protein n=1 Tax=Thermosporothrix hazakensis TaxID=644383 RepID=A0A326U3K8_THEHA|nr:DUF6585 family protein [Thermosporothrix hazakensis]PZW25720.1 hypothetical protein EI42_04214 [Thermosporothrix hazakensis]GCE48217.1 hypothetical protein KTH_30860 [Thermosporothrix hazakensis]